MQLRLTIEGDPMLAWELFDRPKAMEAGVTTVAAPGGVTVRYEGEFEVKAFDVPAVLKVVVQLGREVAVGLFATWLYDKLKGGRARRLRVDRMQVEITEGEIKRVLLERIEEEE